MLALHPVFVAAVTSARVHGARPGPDLPTCLPACLQPSLADRFERTLPDYDKLWPSLQLNHLEHFLSIAVHVSSTESKRRSYDSSAISLLRCQHSVRSFNAIPKQKKKCTVYNIAAIDKLSF